MRLRKVNVTYSMVQTEYGKNGLTVTFGEGNIAPVDPLFADADKGDFHLKSTAGRWTPSGYVNGAVTSPAIGKGYPRGGADKNPERAGGRTNSAPTAIAARRHSFVDCAGVVGGRISVFASRRGPPH